MKNILCILASTLFVFFLVNNTNAQKNKPFQGTVTYNITYNSTTLTPAQKAQLPASVTTTIKDCKTKTVTDYGQASVTRITDGSAKTIITIIDMLGSKYAVKDTVKDSTKISGKQDAPKVNITQETKVISGYTCKKAIVTYKTEDGEVSNDTLFYAEDIGCKRHQFCGWTKRHSWNCS